MLINPAKMLPTSTKIKSGVVLIGLSLVLFLFVVKPLQSSYLYLANTFHVNILSLNIISRTITWLSLVAIYFYANKIERQPFLLWAESPLSTRFCVSSILFFQFITFAGGVIIYYLMYQFGWYNIYKVLHAGNSINIPIKLLYVTTAAVVEELIFKGYLMPRLQYFFKSNYLTILVSAMVFALSHIIRGNITNAVFPLFGGLVYGYFYWKYRNIKGLIICHFITDLIFVLL